MNIVKIKGCDEKHIFFPKEFPSQPQNHNSVRSFTSHRLKYRNRRFQTVMLPRSLHSFNMLSLCNIEYRIHINYNKNTMCFWYVLFIVIVYYIFFFGWDDWRRQNVKCLFASVRLHLSIDLSIYLSIWYSICILYVCMRVTEYIVLGSIKDDQPAKRKWVNTSNYACVRACIYKTQTHTHIYTQFCVIESNILYKIENLSMQIVAWFTPNHITHTQCT